MATLEDYKNRFTRTSYHAGASALGSVAKDVLKWFGAPLAAALLVGMELWNYAFEKKQITSDYNQEIAAKLGTKAELVTTKDAGEVAKSNPTIADAIGRAKRKRNLNIVTDVIGTIGTFALTYYFAVPLAVAIGGAAAATTIAPVLCAAAISFAAFFAGKFILDKIGEKAFGLSEPSLKQVAARPELQEKLSLSSQVKYIKLLQSRRKEIYPEQIITVFNKANPGIEVPYTYAQTLAEKLNNKMIDATELAFIMHGDKSGVPEAELPEVTKLQKINEGLHQQLAAAQNTVAEQASKVSSATKEKVNDFSEKASDYWRNKFGSNKEFDPGKLAEERQAVSPISPDGIRQQQQSSQTPAGNTI